MRNTILTIGVAILLVLAASFALAGCGGDSARVRALGPAMAQAWPGVKESADLGVSARQDPAFCAAHNLGPPWSPGVAEQRSIKIAEFDGAVQTFVKPAPR